MKPDFSILAVFIGGPPDWDGKVDGRNYSDTVAGWDQFGRAVSHIVNKINEQPGCQGAGCPPDRCVAVELYNEPNFTTDIVGGTEVPSYIYGGMAAYLTYWIYQCCGGLTPSGDLKVTPLFGSLALGGVKDTGAWTQEQSPEEYYDDFSDHTSFMLGYLLLSDPVLADQLRAAWRLSIYPYPKQTPFPIPTPDPLPIDWRTDPTVEGGDETGVEAADTVVDHYAKYHFIDRARKIWITETGVSSNKVGPHGQKDFHERIGMIMSIRYETGEDRLEGFIIFGLTDLGPAVCDPETHFYRFGVISDADGVTRKPAADAVEYNFKQRWV